MDEITYTWIKTRSGGPDTLFWLLWVLGTQVVHKHTLAGKHPYTVNEWIHQSHYNNREIEVKKNNQVYNPQGRKHIRQLRRMLPTPPWSCSSSLSFWDTGLLLLKAHLLGWWFVFFQCVWFTKLWFFLDGNDHVSEMTYRTFEISVFNGLQTGEGKGWWEENQGNEQR